MKVNIKKHIVPAVLLSRPVWIVLGAKWQPSIICARLLVPSGGGAIHVLGYSVYDGIPGFRTLGLDLHAWAKQHDLCTVYDNQEEALQRLRKLTTPEKSAW